MLNWTVEIKKMRDFLEGFIEGVGIGLVMLILAIIILFALAGCSSQPTDIPNYNVFTGYETKGE